ncbi:DNA-binding response regulator [Rhizobium sp. TH135]|jgi:DNA-binding NarL/FixJ family response regulator|uniref:Response regulator transcription factor n=3 Tax=Rhizobium TaxID=379 RepID=A0A4S8PLP2_9HYPH|nr:MULTISPECIES: response regulator transcription factor [Rhizobium/Agrobacterium group]MBA4796001.1 response regulator transcription factor [Hyphomicrobiales bacterium]MBU0739475.1 response regulator transcription factor [Alphaproteobacteria bacterium]MBX9469343.1 response regulator transcription factor [Rhizobium sp.]MEC9463624.1 response regulator transcription factor [Pseudomonadota bacterium]ODS51712.1 MAG: two-component system response regulator [Agrobacterium sp. SCN 61-19]
MKVLIVEDDPLHRSYLLEAVCAALPECDKVIEAGNGAEGERLARDHKSAHVVMDLQMNARNGIEAARTIWKERPDTRILFWSNYSDEAYVRGVSRIVPDGAAYGYVLKSASDERLKLALRSIFVEAQCVIDREVRGMQQKSLGQVRGFSDSEYEILVDIALGLTDRTIARRRGLSIRSVQNRLQQLYEKLGVYQMSVEDSDEGRFNLRARAVTVALLRKLLNYSALERAEAELAEWLRSH